MNSFKTPLVVAPLKGGRKWKLVRQFRYKNFTVPVEFVTDFASIPQLLIEFIGVLFMIVAYCINNYWLLGIGAGVVILILMLPVWGKYGKAAVLHDYLYQTKLVSRKEADDTFKEAMKELNVAPWKIFCIYWAVRGVAWIGYYSHSARKL